MSELVERIAKLEIKLEHMEKTTSTMSAQVNEMHDLLLKAKGARWALGVIALIAGWVGGKASALLPWFLALPK